MGLRLRKRIKIVPGISLNLSKSGVSASIGRPGATLNVGGPKGSRLTVGIPGSGISYSEQLSTATKQERSAPGMSFGALLLWGFALLFVGLVLYGIVSG